MRTEADMVLDLLEAIALHLRTTPREPTRCAPTTEANYHRVISHRSLTGNTHRDAPDRRALKTLGNGVVPQQAAHAIRIMRSTQ